MVGISIEVYCIIGQAVYYSKLYLYWKVILYFILLDIPWAVHQASQANKIILVLLKSSIQKEFQAVILSGYLLTNIVVVILLPEILE